MFTLKKFGGLFNVGRIAGVPVYVHWSVIAIAAFMLTGAVKKPLVTSEGSEEAETSTKESALVPNLLNIAT